MKLSYVVGTEPERNWKVAQQLGINSAVICLHDEYLKKDVEISYERLIELKQNLLKYNLSLDIVKGDLLPMEDVKLGLSTRDKTIEKYCEILELLGSVGVETVRWEFMPCVRWRCKAFGESSRMEIPLRTREDKPGRGGALVTHFSYEETKGKVADTQGKKLTEDMLWENISYFLNRVLPVAEKLDIKMSLHLDDPPISPIMGVPRIITSQRAYDKLIQMFSSPNNGITFCQANFSLMKDVEDVYQVAEKYAKSKRIHYVHYRDVKGTVNDFVETFHDNGPTDMVRILEIYNKSLPDLKIRPDHAPLLEGEENYKTGYAPGGNLFAYGYMKGILDTLEYKKNIL